jgi:hypothetical protein
LAAVAERALSRDPALRYRDAAELSNDMQAWSTGARVAAYDYSAWQLARRFARRNKFLLAVAAVVLATIVYAAANFVAVQIARVRAVESKAALDSRITKLESDMQLELDPQRLGSWADELVNVARLADQTTATVRALGGRVAPYLPARGEADEAIHALLARFGADTYAVPPLFVERVAFHVERIRKAPNTGQIYARKLRYWPIIERYFAAYGLPIEMAYVAWTESQFDPDAASSVGARGMWQFMPATARAYGLRVDAEADERTDVEKSTRAAVQYLSGLIAEFGGTESFMLAIGSYNKGEHGLRKLLRDETSSPGGWRRERREFWRLFRLKRLSGESLEYVPQTFAVIIANSEPKKYGLER